MEEEELVSFDTAKLAKEKGFNIPCKYYFDVIKFKEKPVGFFDKLNANGLMGWSDKFSKPVPLGLISCPTQTLLQKWIRETHNLDIEVYMNHEFGVKFYTILILKLEGAVVTWLTGNITKFEKYEDALEVALVEALNLLP